MKINVIDVEATCWDKDKGKGLQKSEIIEIGIVVLDLESLTISDKRSILVTPYFSTVSPFCTELTTITQEMLDEHGIDYTEAVQILIDEYKTNKTQWASWGDYDRSQFERNAELYNTIYPFGKRHLNIKALHSMLRNQKACGVGQACENLGIPFEGTLHRGDDDAENIAKIYIEDLKQFRNIS